MEQDTFNISLSWTKSGEEMLFCVQIRIHQEMSCHGAAQWGQACAFWWPWPPESSHSVLPAQPRCKEAGAPGGLGAELQMSGPAWPLSARVMH